MSNNEESTPRNTRSRLALRRKVKTTGPAIRSHRNLCVEQQADSNDTPTNSKRAKLNVNDAIAGTQSGTKPPESSENESTPRDRELKRLTGSTNGVAYRLTLNSSIRKRLTKRRLEFVLANELNNPNSCVDVFNINRVPEPHPNDEMPSEETKTNLITKIQKAEEELRTLEVHTRKIKDLENAINKWRIAFANALDDLQEKIEPRIDKAALLEKLGINPEMLKYAND